MAAKDRRRTVAKQPAGRPPARASGRVAGGTAAGGRTAATPSRRPPIVLLVGLVVVVAAALAVGLALGGSSHPNSRGAASADAATVGAQATSVPQAVSDQIGRGDALVLPRAISGPPLNSGGKPEMLYIGAEYCPYCATERWAMVIALSRFGTFQGLGLTHSSSTDVYPNTPTFTFHGSTFSSPYLTFTPVETETNQPDGNGGYQPLDTPTADETRTLQTLDPSGGIPFIDIGGRYLVSGVTYDPAVLQGKTAGDVAASLANPTTGIARGAVGAANTLVAAICNLTNQQPASVCTAPAIQSIQRALG